MLIKSFSMSGECDKCGNHALECICKEHEEYHDHLSYMEKAYLSKNLEVNSESLDFFKDMRKLDTLRANLIRKLQ